MAEGSTEIAARSDTARDHSPARWREPVRLFVLYRRRIVQPPLDLKARGTRRDSAVSGVKDGTGGKGHLRRLSRAGMWG